MPFNKNLYTRLKAPKPPRFAFSSSQEIRDKRNLREKAMKKYVDPLAARVHLEITKHLTFFKLCSDGKYYTVVFKDIR